MNLNATQAAIRTGHSASTAGHIGYENLRKPEIQAAIAMAQAEPIARVHLTQNDVIAGLHREANLIGEGSSHSARVTAWQALGKHLGMFTSKFDVKVAHGLAARLEAVRKRAKDLRGSTDFAESWHRSEA